MARSRIVRPECTVLPISEGDTLTVKRRLTAGEQRDSFARMYRMNEAGDLRVDPLQSGIAVILAYLVDWTLVDPEGRLIEIRGHPAEDVIAALDAIDPDSFREIKIAIETHEQRMIAERAEEKKTRTGDPGS